MQDNAVNHDARDKEQAQTAVSFEEEIESEVSVNKFGFRKWVTLDDIKNGLKEQLSQSVSKEEKVAISSAIKELEVIPSNATQAHISKELERILNTPEICNNLPALVTQKIQTYISSQSDSSRSAKQPQHAEATKVASPNAEAVSDNRQQAQAQAPRAQQEQAQQGVPGVFSLFGSIIHGAGHVASSVTNSILNAFNNAQSPTEPGFEGLIRGVSATMREATSKNASMEHIQDDYISLAAAIHGKIDSSFDEFCASKGEDGLEAFRELRDETLRTAEHLTTHGTSEESKKQAKIAQDLAKKMGELIERMMRKLSRKTGAPSP